MKKLFIIFLSFLFIPIVKAETDFAPNAKSAILIESSTGEVLFEKNADERLAPASMTKIASMLIIMEAIDNQTLSFDDEVTISKEAASMGGSQVFLKEGEVYKVSELLKGVAIASGNDAIYALSEKVAGSHDAFVGKMNEVCQRLGCQNTNFMNVHGLDADNHYASARDMALLAKELVKHETILAYTSIYEEYLIKNDGSKTWLVNTNKLVRFYKGVDGLKTGFTEKAGYCLTSTAKKNNLRLISVVMGEASSEVRSSDTVKMLNYGFNSYKINLIKEKDVSLGKIKVEKGKTDVADLGLIEDATEILNIADKLNNYQFKISISKIKAPLKKGDIVGDAQIIDEEGNVLKTVHLTVLEDIPKANYWDYFKRNIKIITSGKVIIRN